MLYEHLDWSFLDYSLIIVLVDCVLQKYHEEDQNLLKPPRLSISGYIFKEFRKSVTNVDAFVLEGFFHMRSINICFEFFERIHLVPDAHIYLLRVE